MARREYRNTFKCAEGGCREVSYHSSETRAEQSALLQRQRDKPFKCSRHEHPERNLRPGNEQTSYVLVASRGRGGSADRLYWLREGEDRVGSGYSYGPGFNAHASDFPEGTRLVVTARIELPAPCACSCGCAAPGKRDDDGTPGRCDPCRMNIHPGDAERVIVLGPVN